MKPNQKTAIIGIVAVTLVLAVLVLVTTGRSSSSEQTGEEKAVSAANKHTANAQESVDALVLSEEQIKSSGIVVETAGPASIVTTLTLPGEIRFNQDRTAHIVPRIDGIVESVSAELGQSVKKDQILAVLASTTIAELRSEAMASRKRLALAHTTYAREKKLWEDRISAEQDYLQARQALQEAEIAAQNATEKLRALGASTDAGSKAKGGLNRYALRAPFDGMIVERHMSLGESVQSNTNVMTLSDLSTVWAEIVVSAKDLNTVQVGTQVMVKAASFDSQTTGRVSYVGSLLGEQTRTATARVTLPNPAYAWRPGLFVNVEIVAGEVEAPIAVQPDAVQTLENRSVVFVRTADGFKAVPVELGRTDGKCLEIKSGLDAGAQYAAQGSFVLKSELGKASAEHAH